MDRLSLGIDEVARRVQSEFNVLYLDDAAIGDTPERVLEDVKTLSAIGLEVNSAKCELTILDDDAPGETELLFRACLLYTSPSPRDKRQSRMPSSA